MTRTTSAVKAKSKASEAETPALTPVPSIPKSVSRILGMPKVQIADIEPFQFGNEHHKMRPRMTEVLKGSIDEFGYVDPIITRKLPSGKYEILGGHHRWEDLKARGVAEIEVTLIDCPDDGKARALALALNRISADWDPKGVNNYIEKLLLEEDFAPKWLADVTGFSGAEVPVLATVGQNFLDELADGPRPEREGAKGNGGSGTTDRIQFLVYLSPAEQSQVEYAIAKAKKQGATTTSEALVMVCKAFGG